MTADPDYAEITTYLRGRFRPLMGQEDRAFAQLNALPDEISREAFLAASPLPDTVTKFLVQLDAKIDALLAAQYSSMLEQDFPHPMEVLAISASRLRLATMVPLAVGDRLEVIINLRQTGTGIAAGIGHITARSVNEDGTSVFSFSFTRILEEEREKIIRYVFKEERRRLRASRLEEADRGTL